MTVFVVLTRVHWEGDTIDGIYTSRSAAEDRKKQLEAAGQCGVLIIQEIPLDTPLTVNETGDYEPASRGE